MNQPCEKDVVETLNSHLDKNALVRDFRTGAITKDDVHKIIAESGPSITEPLGDGYTLLHSFSVLGEYDIVKLLWEKGVRPTSCEKKCTVLQCAVRTHPSIEGDCPRDEDRAKMLRLYFTAKDTHGQYMPIDHRSPCGWPVLKMATRLHLENCVEVLLENGANPMVPGYFLLHYAVGNPAIIKMLLNACSNNINSLDREGRTALFMAIETGKVASALTLLERGADPNIRNKEGIAPLFQAAKMGQMDVVRALVKSGGDVNAPGGGQGITALHWAAFKEMEELVVFLIENGADVTAMDTKGRTPLTMVSEKLQLKMKEVAKRCRPGLCPSTLAAPPAMTAEHKAMEACCHGNISALCNLIKSGVDVNFTCKQTQSSLLHRAAYYGQASAVVFLAHHGANMKDVDKDNDNVLHFANMKDFPHGCHVETLRFLVGCMQVDINAQNRLGDTPLMLAVRNCLTRRLRLLLKFKASVNITNHRGETPLHAACHCPQSVEILFHIVDQCKDLDVRDSSGLTPLMHSAKHNCAPGAKYLLQKGAQANLRDPQGRTALLMATENLNWDMMEVLLMGGADPKIPGSEKNITPLHVATLRMNKMMVKLLLEHGADVEIKDADGNTPLDVLPSSHLREAIKMAVRARHEIRSELRAPRDKNASCPMATPTSPSFNDCMTTPTCSDFVPCNEKAPPCDRDEDGCSIESSESVGEDSGYCISSSDLHWGRTLTAHSSTMSSPEEDEEEEEEEETLEEEEAEVDEIGDGQPSLERYQKLQAEVSRMRKAYVESRETLKSATRHNEELNAQIKSLMEEMQRKETLTVSRHLHHAVALSMHAICHNVLVDPQHQENPQALANKSHEMTLIDAYKRVGLEEKEMEGARTTADERTQPICTGSDKGRDSDDALSDDLDDAEHARKRGCHSLIDKRTDSLESSCSETSQEDNFRYVGGCSGMGLHHRPLSMIQPINRTQLQWWMVSKSDYELSGESLNKNSDLNTSFFDVSRGTFRHMDVAVRTVKGVTEWKIEFYFSFFKEVNFLSCLHCPWIVQFLCACFDSNSGTCSIINEWMHHGSLHSILHEKKMELDWDTRLNIAWDVSRGMVFLHSHQLLHRSLNPSNILIGEHFNAKLSDFGLYETKLKSEHYKKPNYTHQAYMAPEALGKKDFTMATDTYSFGIIMFECSTSNRAFADLLNNPMVLGVQLMMGARPNFPSDVASNYKNLAAQCWQQDPDSRPTFENVADSLKQMKSNYP